jgi:hypothetical protein
MEESKVTPSVRRTGKKLQDCFSFRGEDFCCAGSPRYAKRFTSRARRRFGRAVVRQEAS